MKKITFVLAAVLTLIISLGVAGYTYAQTQTPPLPYRGMMGGYGMSGIMEGHHRPGGMMNGSGYGFHGRMMGTYGYGPMHEYMVNALAEGLDLTAEELQARVEAGERMWDIAAGQGLSEENITALMQSTHNLAIEQAVADGVITQEQAEWMNSHME